MGKGKSKILECCGIVCMILLIMGIFLQPLYAAESQFGIWCPGCGKWQDCYRGVVDSGSFIRTEYKNGNITYGNSGLVYVHCKECNKKLLKFEWSEVPLILNAGTSNEQQMWNKRYGVEKCEEGVIFPYLKTILEINTNGEESYQILCDGDVFTETPDEIVTKEKYKDATNYLKKLFDAMVKCMTIRQENNSDSSVESIYTIKSGDFTWAQWYDSGRITITSGSVSSGLIDYLARFGREAVREKSYKITFYANGGEGSLVIASMQPGSSPLPKNNFVRRGYIFLGWATSMGGSVQYTDEERVEISSDLTLYAVWKKEPPKLSVSGDVQVKLYRDGVFFDGEVEAGDQVEIIPNKKQGREYADYSISAGQASWDESSGTLCFTMPDMDISIEVFFRELRGLEVSLNSLFFETYQKEPYWDGSTFNLDCSPPITIENAMLKVDAVFYNTKTSQMEKREIQNFSIVSGNTIQSMGENVVVVEADVLQDGGLFRAQCMVRADSTDLKDLMNQTDSKTYTDLKEFVERLTARLAECEMLMEELSKKLADSEAEKENYESLLADANAEIDRLTKELDKAGKEIDRLVEELAASKKELGSMEEELAGMKEKLAAVQKLMQELTGTEEFDPSIWNTLKEKFEELKQEKEELADLLAKLEEENKGLSDKVSQLESEKNGLENEKTDLTDKVAGLENEKSDLTDKVAGLENEKSDLADKVSGLETEKSDLGDKLSDLENENGDLTSRYEALYAAHKELLKERDALLQAKQTLKNQNRDLLAENENLAGQNKRLSADNARLAKSNGELSDQLQHAIEEQKLFFKEYDLLKNQFGQQDLLKEQETEKLAGMEQKLREAEREKNELSDQIARMEQERVKQGTEWQREKTEMSASIRKLEQELEEKRKIEEETVQKTERETVSKPSEKESVELEKETLDEEAAEKETAGWSEELEEKEELESMEEAETNEEEELETRFSEENESEFETETVDAVQESEEMTGGEQETENKAETEITTEAITEEETSAWIFPIKDKDKGSFGGGKKILPGIFIVIAAMLLGGLVLYVAMDQKEKEADYSS